MNVVIKAAKIVTETLQKSEFLFPVLAVVYIAVVAGAVFGLAELLALLF